MGKFTDIFRKRILISTITATAVIGLSLTAFLVLNKPVYSGTDIIITPPAGRTPKPSPSGNDYPYPGPSGVIPGDTLPSWNYNDIYVVDNLNEKMIKVIYSDGTVNDITGIECVYDKSLDKGSVALVNSDKILWLFDRNGKNQINTYIDSAYISDSGEYIYYMFDNNNILSRYDKNNGEHKVIYNFSDNESISDCTISPDGEIIVYTRGNVTYGLKDGGTGDVKIYSDITKVLAVTNNLNFVYGYNEKDELICVDSENRVIKLSSSSKAGNIYFSNTRNNVIFLENNEYCLFDGSETKVICSESDIMLQEDEKLMKNITDNVYLVNKAGFTNCYFGNEKRTYMLNNSYNANVIAEYKLNFVDYTSSYYYIKNEYLYYYNEKFIMDETQIMDVKEGSRILKVFNNYEIYYINSQNKLCYWNGTENETNIEQPDIDNMSFLSDESFYGSNTAYFVEKEKGVRIYMGSREIKTVEWTDKTIEMKLEQTSSGIILYRTENVKDSIYNNQKLYLLKGESEVYLGTRYVDK